MSDSQRLGALRYLNALPLIDGLEHDPDVGEVCYEIPSLLARDLAEGRLDLALVPWVEALRHDDYKIVPDIGIGCDGAVESILLFTRGNESLSAMKRIGVDLSSRSSVELLRVLLHQQGASADLVEIPPRLDPLRDPASGLDAVLLIGDRALAEDHGEFPRWDLGTLWKDETGLPFVFAVWLGRASASPGLRAAVSRAAARGLGRRRSLAEDFTREHPEVADADGAERYLTDVIRYVLGPAEIEAMTTFQRLRVEAGLADNPRWSPQFFAS